MSDQAPTASMAPCLPPANYCNSRSKEPYSLVYSSFISDRKPSILQDAVTYILNCSLGCRFSLRRATSGSLRCRVPHANDGARRWCSVFFKAVPDTAHPQPLSIFASTVILLVWGALSLFSGLISPLGIYCVYCGNYFGPGLSGSAGISVRVCCAGYSRNPP
jgi:hypothetical protein